ncbi:hypothetical protein G6W61_10100 [Streptomyces sp. KAI-26]|uniref:hypothetical protein n=1 Tax=Streptomyces sp. KAI-26 TaxID=1169747 RepID=UPI0015871016|nr:hypothetical protein [Streptomyces sp. KAI-26]NUV86559.1 hypothetical protein [Streptomyces sp. KAI-26]NUW21246.1 hypothetical protein [Streptomyces roseoviolaceus]
MYERKKAPLGSPPPFGAKAETRAPGQIKVGDYVFLGGAYRRVTDMRSDGASRRTLIFADHFPLRVGALTVTYRPPARP